MIVAFFIAMLSVVMLNIAMLSVVKLFVVTPYRLHCVPTYCTYYLGWGTIKTFLKTCQSQNKRRPLVSDEGERLITLKP